MNPPCARCKKIVYPVEKLNCLDKTWHKKCFSCEVCGLKLTMKTYKGYNKLPYCETHYPTTKFTAVADTPENRRLAQQTKQQSDLVYRKDREEALKQFTQVSDTVQTRQAQMAGKLASNIGYFHAPEAPQHAPSSSYHPPQTSYQPPQPSYQPPPQPSYQPPPQPSYQPPPSQPSPVRQPPPPAGPRYRAMYDYTAADDDEVSFQDGDYIINVEIIDDGWMEGTVQRTGQRGMLPSNYVDKTWHKKCFSCEVCGLKLTMKTYKGYNKLPYCETHYPTTKFTAVADTPENRRLAQQTKQQSDLVYRKDREEALKQFTQVSDTVQTRQAQMAGKLASNIGYFHAPEAPQHAPSSSYHPPQTSYQPPQPSYQPPPQPSYQPPPQPSYQPPPSQPSPVRQPPPPAGPRYRAMYDYTAADDDEVSFQDGDYIINVEIIDDGWMEGTVQRTGQRGMLPSNYVEKV